MYHVETLWEKGKGGLQLGETVRITVGNNILAKPLLPFFLTPRSILLPTLAKNYRGCLACSRPLICFPELK